MQAQSRAATAEALVEQLAHSSSWRMTAPLRQIKKALLSTFARVTGTDLPVLQQGQLGEVRPALIPPPEPATPLPPSTPPQPILAQPPAAAPPPVLAHLTPRARNIYAALKNALQEKG